MAADQGWVTAGQENTGRTGYARLDGGLSSWAIAALTNAPPRADQLSGYGNPAATAWNAGVPYALGTGQNPNYRLWATHAYALVGYNPSATYPFLLFNPHNNGACSGDRYGSVFYAQGGFLSSSNFAVSMYANATSGEGQTVSLDVGVELQAFTVEDTAGVKVGTVVVAEPRVVAVKATPAAEAASPKSPVATTESSRRAMAFSTLASHAGVEQAHSTGSAPRITATAWRNLHLARVVEA